MRKTALLLAPIALAMLLACVVCVVTLVAATKPAEAAFAGLNGKIAFSSTRDGNSEIYTMNPNGSSVTRLTNDSGSLVRTDDQPA